MPDHVPSAELPPDGPLTLSSGRVVPRERVEQGGDHIDVRVNRPTSWHTDSTRQGGRLIVDQSQAVESFPLWMAHELIDTPACSLVLPPSLEPRRVWKEITHDGHTFLGWDWESTADRIENEDIRFSVEIQQQYVPWNGSDDAQKKALLAEVARCNALRAAFGMPTIAEERAAMVEQSLDIIQRGEVWQRGREVISEAGLRELFTATQRLPVTANSESIGYVESIDEDGTADFVITNPAYRDTIVNGQQWPYLDSIADLTGEIHEALSARALVSQHNREAMERFGPYHDYDSIRPHTPNSAALSIAEQARSRK